jgi:hypothetical protein
MVTPDLAADHWTCPSLNRSPHLAPIIPKLNRPCTPISRSPSISCTTCAHAQPSNPPTLQNFSEEGVGECDSGEYCRFVHPGPRWANARSYHNRDDFDHISKYLASGGGGGGRGRPGGGGVGGRGPIPRRCRVSLFSFLSDVFPPALCICTFAKWLFHPRALLETEADRFSPFDRLGVSFPSCTCFSLFLSLFSSDLDPGS